jgi:voltage-gated potassium channel
MPKLEADQKRALDSERLGLLARLERALRGPMMVLGFIWLVLLVVQLVNGLSPKLAWIETAIWIAFIVDFVLRFWVAPKKKQFLKHNWLTTLALIVPALRVFQFLRFIRLLRVTGGFNIVKIVGTLNRGMQALGRTLGRRGFGYVSLLTLIVTLVGAAGMYGFEHTVNSPGGIHDYPTAVYWTFMLITTIGSEYWPQTGGGRILTALLSLYAVAILGYIAASLATFFIDRDADNKQAAVAGQQQVEQVLAEVRALREELRKSQNSQN